MNPAWSPDGSRIAFSSDRTGSRDIYWKLSSGAGAEELLVDSKDSKSVEDWSRDGKFILYNAGDAKGIWAMPVTGDRKPFSVLNDAFTEAQGKISPDGRWIAYRSNESGRNEIFVQSFPPSAGKWQISNGGGSQPSWRADGQELYYVSRSRIMAVAIKASGGGIEAGTPQVLFDVPTLKQDTRRNNYAVTQDGKRFLCQTTPENIYTTPLTLVLNWHAALKK
jgi:Tol biopolymer transport system component